MEKQNKNPFYHDEDFADIIVVNGEDVTLSYEGESSVRHVYVKFRGDSPLNWQDYANEYNEEDNWISLDKEKSKRMTAELVQAIEDSSVSSFLFSFEKWGEGHFLSGDFAGGWAALYYEDSDENIHYSPHNASYDTVEILAPVYIGGQSPVPKRFALDDMSLVARIAAHFLETGQLCPGTQWVKEIG